MTEQKLLLKHRIPLTGEYNPMVTKCPECERGGLNELFNSIIGLSSHPVLGDVVVCECPYCFTKWYFHDRGLGICYAEIKEAKKECV